MLDRPPSGRVAVVGLGLLGGSLLRRLDHLGAGSGARARGLEVVGYDVDPATRAAARAAATREGLGARWQVAGSVEEALGPLDGSGPPDLVVLAVPAPALGEVLDGVARSSYAGVVTDVTSVKAPVHALVRDRLPGGRFVGGHPMAGTERSGFAASDEGLLDGCAWVLCLESGTDLADWLRVARLVVALGARVVPATASDHDAAVARVSHLPHLVATALAEGAATGLEHGPGVGLLALALGAGAFRDGTRVAATRPRLTAAMCGGNAQALAGELDALVDRLSAARRLLDRPDPVRALEGWLAAGHRVRAAWPPSAGTEVEVPATPDALLALGRAGGWVTAVADDGRTVTAVRPR